MKPSRLAADFRVLGSFWYPESMANIRAWAQVEGYCPERAVSVLALTSPRVHVKRNGALTRQYLETGSTAGMLPSTIRALEHWEATREIRGPKTRAFRDALLGDTSAVVVDTWILKAFKLRPGQVPYREVARRLRGLATRAGMHARDYQAAMWIGARRAANMTDPYSPIIMR